MVTPQGPRRVRLPQPQQVKLPVPLPVSPQVRHVRLLLLPVLENREGSLPQVGACCAFC